MRLRVLLKSFIIAAAIFTSAFMLDIAYGSECPSGKICKPLVVYINGLGRSEKAVGFSDKIQKALGDKYDHKEIMWQDIIETPLDVYFEKVYPEPSSWRWKKKLTWTIRKALFDYAGDEIVYDSVKPHILKRLKEALKNRWKVSFIAHSLGSIMASDYIQENGPNNIHKLITIGSPLALFSLPGKPTGGLLLKKGSWTNYIEPNDVLAMPILDSKVNNVEFNSGNIFKSWNVASHNSYFKSKKLIKLIKKELDK